MKVLKLERKMARCFVVEGFLKQTYLLSVFRMMSEDGGRGRSKVSCGLKDNGFILVFFL